MDRLEWLPRVALVGAPAQLSPRSYLLRPAGLGAGALPDRFLDLFVDLFTDM